MDYRLETAKVKSLGSSRSGAYRHSIQRITAVALVPLVMWLVISTIILIHGSAERVAEFISSPAQLIMLILLTICGMAHGLIGMKVIIEDYVKCNKMKLILFFTLDVICVVTALSAVIAALTLHLFFILRLPGL